jgi:hypothetical protein
MPVVEALVGVGVGAAGVGVDAALVAALAALEAAALAAAFFAAEEVLLADAFVGVGVADAGCVDSACVWAGAADFVAEPLRAPEMPPAPVFAAGDSPTLDVFSCAVTPPAPNGLDAP